MNGSRGREAKEGRWPRQSVRLRSVGVKAEEGSSVQLPAQPRPSPASSWLCSSLPVLEQPSASPPQVFPFGPCLRDWSLFLAASLRLGCGARLGHAPGLQRHSERAGESSPVPSVLTPCVAVHSPCRCPHAIPQHQHLAAPSFGLFQCRQRRTAPWPSLSQTRWSMARQRRS